MAFLVRTADIDADGDPDVLSASWFDNTIAWYENCVKLICRIRDSGRSRPTLSSECVRGDTLFHPERVQHGHHGHAGIIAPP